MILDVTPSKTVEELKQNVRSWKKHDSGDMHVTFEGKVLRERDELRGCGISDGSTIQIASRMRGGRMHKNRTERERSETQTQRGQNCRKNKKQSFSWRRTQTSWVAKRDTVVHERDRDKVIW